jgi:tetratricopeptide (TPR) repeat protein
MLRRFPDALRKFDQVLNITPDDVDTVLEKASIAQAEGDLPRASAILAALHPADATGVFGTQVYQAILERRPAPIIPRLQDILGNPASRLGYRDGKMRSYLGWAQQVAGDHAAAQESWRQARSELEPVLKEQPENHSVIAHLALANVALGDKTVALNLIERIIAAGNSLEKDALEGAYLMEVLARVAAQTGEPDRAIAALERVLSIPAYGFMGPPLTPALLRLDPMFDPIRDDPRFQKLCQKKTP